MKLGFLGRTKSLAETAELFYKNGFEICFIWTCKAENFYKFSEQDFKKLAKKLNCDFIYSSDTKDGYKLIKKKPDIIISLNFINIIPEAFLKKFKFGILNAHLGDLPRYRGNACPNWAILNDENYVALTIHEMSKALDAGDIYLKEKFFITNNTYITEIYNWAEQVIPSLFIKTVKMIMKGKKPKPQSKMKPLRTFPRKIIDSKIDWTLSQFSILKLIRASSHPFEGAFCYLNGDINKKVKIFKAKLINLEFDYLAIDGQILTFNDKTFVVSINNSPLRITEFKLNNYDQEKSLKHITSSLRNRLT